MTKPPELPPLDYQPQPYRGQDAYFLLDVLDRAFGASEGSLGVTSPLKIQDLTHAHPDVDAIYAAEEHGLPAHLLTKDCFECIYPDHRTSQG